MSFNLINVLARKCTDGTVEVFHENGEPFCKYGNHLSSKPDYRHKRINLNCYTWNLVWIKGVFKPFTQPFHRDYGVNLNHMQTR